MKFAIRFKSQLAYLENFISFIFHQVKSGLLFKVATHLQNKLVIAFNWELFSKLYILTVLILGLLNQLFVFDEG